MLIKDIPIGSIIRIPLTQNGWFALSKKDIVKYIVGTKTSEMMVGFEDGKEMTRLSCPTTFKGNSNIKQGAYFEPNALCELIIKEKSNNLFLFAAALIGAGIASYSPTIKKEEHRANQTS